MHSNNFVVSLKHQKMIEIMKTFEDLHFEQHPTGMPYFNKQATIEFTNKYGISVINGRHAYCDENTFEVAIFYDGEITYTSGITNDVLGYQTPKQITKIMQKLQKIN